MWPGGSLFCEGQGRCGGTVGRPYAQDSRHRGGYGAGIDGRAYCLGGNVGCEDKYRGRGGGTAAHHARVAGRGGKLVVVVDDFEAGSYLDKQVAGAAADGVAAQGLGFFTGMAGNDVVEG